MDDAQARADRLQRYVDGVLQARARIASLLPDIAPEDLILILQSLLRPPESGRAFLLRELRPGVYVF